MNSSLVWHYVPISGGVKPFKLTITNYETNKGNSSPLNFKYYMHPVSDMGYVSESIEQFFSPNLHVSTQTIHIFYCSTIDYHWERPFSVGWECGLECSREADITPDTLSGIAVDRCNASVPW